jgi:hypothetical protein
VWPGYLKKLSPASWQELTRLFPPFRNLEEGLGRPRRYRCFPPGIVFWMFLHPVLKMETLKCGRPEMVQKELCRYWIAYHLLQVFEDSS